MFQVCDDRSILLVNHLPVELHEFCKRRLVLLVGQALGNRTILDGTGCLTIMEAVPEDA